MRAKRRLWLTMIGAVLIPACGQGVTDTAVPDARGGPNSADTIPYERSSAPARTSRVDTSRVDTSRVETSRVETSRVTVSTMTSSRTIPPSNESGTVLVPVGTAVPLVVPAPDATDIDALVSDRYPEMAMGFPFPELFLDDAAATPTRTTELADDHARGWATVLGFDVAERDVHEVDYQWPNGESAWIEVQAFDTPAAATSEMNRWRNHRVRAVKNAFAENIPGGSRDAGRWTGKIVERARYERGSEYARSTWWYLRRAEGNTVITFVIDLTSTADKIPTAAVNEMLGRIDHVVAAFATLPYRPDPLVLDAPSLWPTWSRLGAVSDDSYVEWGYSSGPGVEVTTFPAIPDAASWSTTRRVFTVCTPGTEQLCMNEATVLWFADTGDADAWLRESLTAATRGWDLAAKDTARPGWTVGQITDTGRVRGITAVRIGFQVLVVVVDHADGLVADAADASRAITSHQIDRLATHGVSLT